MCYAVNDHIRDTDRNVTEWCKRDECWQKLKDRPAPALPGLAPSMVRGKKSDFHSASDNDAVEICKTRGSDAWKDLAKWLKDMGFMSGKARSQCFNMGRCLDQKREPSLVLSKACKDIWEQAERSYGWNVPAADGQNSIC